MTKEMETRRGISERIEILPEGIGEMPAIEAAPLLERAASRTETLGWKGEFWDGVRENIEGAAAWIKAEKAGFVKKTLSVVVGVSFLGATLSACTNGPSTPYLPSETGPRVTEVSPTATEITPTPTITSTETPTPTITETSTATLEPTGVYSEVYTFADFEEREVTFEELPFIDYKILSEDDLSTSIQVGDKIMEKALPVEKWLNGVGETFSFVSIERYDPSFSSYIGKPETRPFEVVRAFRTNVDGKDFPGAIILVKNSDGSTTKLKVLFPSFFAQKGNEKYLNEQLKNGPATNWALISVTHGSKSVTGYPGYEEPAVSYIDYEFSSTPDELESIKKLMFQWQQTGVAPADLAKYILEADFGLW